MERTNRDKDFMKKILFTDESSFSLTGHHNPSVTVGYSTENRHISVPYKTQYRQKVNVWAGILGDTVISPFFTEGTLCRRKYLYLLRNHIIPAVRALPMDEIWLQQDGSFCPAYNVREVLDFLNITFPDRVISTKRTIKMPPRSPYLAPLDFFAWGYVKEQIYRHEHERHERARNLDEFVKKSFRPFEA